jgi:hypothetical protein
MGFLDILPNETIMPIGSDSISVQQKSPTVLRSPNPNCDIMVVSDIILSSKKGQTSTTCP